MEQWKRNLYAVWFTQVLSLAGFGFFNPFVPYFLQDLGLTDPARLNLWVGLMSSMPSLVMTITAPLWGYLADRFGKKPMILRAMLGGGLAIGLMSISPNYQIAFILRCFLGAVAGSVPATQTLVASGTPVKRISFALGFLSSSTFIGLSIGPLIGGISAELLGYRRSFLIGAAIMGLGAVLVALLIREPKWEIQEDDRPVGGFTWKSLLVHPFLIIFITLFMTRFSQMLPTPFIPLYVQQLLGRLEGAAAATGAIAAGASAFTALSGLTLVRLGDRYDKMRLTMLFLGACAAFALPQYLVPRLWAFILFRLLTIFFLGGVEPMLQAFLGSVTPKKNRGTIFGIYTSVSHFGWFFSPLLGSAVSIVFDLRTIFLFYSLSFLLSLGVLAAVRLAHRRRHSDPFGKGTR